MRVLITGGAGFIGSHIVEQFTAAGNQILVVDDLSSGKRENLKAGIELVEVDIRNPQAQQVIKDFAPDLLVHAAAQMSVRESMADPANDVDINVAGLINILTALPQDKLPFFVFLSTGGAIYGEQDNFPCDEQHPTRPISVYGASKLASEIYLALWSRAFGLKCAMLRLSNVYGPRQNPHGEAGVVAIFSNALMAGQAVKIYGDGEQTRDYIFVADVARAVHLAAESKAQGVFNIGTGIETSVNELHRQMAQHFANALPASYQPSRSGEQLRSCINPSAAEKAFGWRAQMNLTDGLAQTIAWAKSVLE